MTTTGSYRTEGPGLHRPGPERGAEPLVGAGEIGLTVNGEPRRARAGLSVADLVGECGLANRACAVEVNKSLVPKSRHALTPLKDGDTVELVTLVGGG
jgi:sulfur carrier protein